jgi:hypothetical protein
MTTIESGEAMRGILSRGRWIIGALLAVLLLGGCASLLRLGYGQGPTVVYWWLDGYVDLNGEQTPRVRDAIDQWFDWHRRTQLPDHAALLVRAQREVLHPMATPESICAWRELATRRLEAAVEHAAPGLAALIVTLTPEQLRHMERKMAKDGAEMRSSFAQADRAERARAAFKRTLDRFETVYGRLDEVQRQRLAQALAASPFDPERWLAEREQRNADMMRTLAAVAASGDTARAHAAVLALAERALRSPRPEYRAYQERLAVANCALVASMHEAMTPSQRQQARAKLKAWEDDLRALAGSPVNGGGTARTPS